MSAALGLGVPVYVDVVDGKGSVCFWEAIEDQLGDEVGGRYAHEVYITFCAGDGVLLG